MTDVMPDHSNKFAVWISRIVHPFLLPIPSTVVMLSGNPLGEVVKWTVIVLGMLLVPGIALAAWSRRRGRHLHVRESRNMLYLIAWGLIFACFAVVALGGAPRELVASIGAMVVWIPMQWAINRYVTKISMHSAVATGSFMTLLMAGKLVHPALVIGYLIIVLLTLWSRIETRNHSVLQVMMGALGGVLPVLIVFPLVL